ncbi:MAG: hypothetical protein AAF587_08870 [Bacteroidota bacterium]
MLDSVKELITDGKLPEAFDTLRALIEDPQHANELIGYMARYNDLEKHVRANSLSHDEITRDKSKLTQSLLSLISEVEEKSSTLSFRTAVPLVLHKYRLWIFLSLNIISLLGIWAMLRSPLNSQEEISNSSIGQAIVIGYKKLDQDQKTELLELKNKLKECKEESRNCNSIEEEIAIKESKRIMMNLLRDSIINLDSYQEEEKIKILTQALKQITDNRLEKESERILLTKEVERLQHVELKLLYKFDSLSLKTTNYNDSVNRSLQFLETRNIELSSKYEEYKERYNNVKDSLEKVLNRFMP